jgi:long-subunit fatty acid transport protein
VYKASRLGRVLTGFAGFVLSGFFICGLWVTGAAASGYEFDGIGARAVARGGAVIADASDRAPEAGLELRAGQLTSKDGNSFKNPLTTFTKKTNSPSFVLGSAGGAVPMGANSALGFGVYVPIMQGVSFKDTDTLGLYNKFKSDGYAALAVTNVSYGSKVGDKFSAGAGLDIIYAQLKSKSVSDFTTFPLAPVGPDVMKTNLDGHGYGVEGVFGLKYRQNDTLTYGAVFRTGSKFDIKGDASVSHTNGFLPAEQSDFILYFKHPPTSGAGVAWKAKSNLTLTGDITQTWWKGFSNKTHYDTPGAMVLQSSGNTYDWVNSVKVRVGALWNYDEKTDFLFGYAFDTPAIDSKSVDFSTAIDVPMHRFSAAVTHKFGSVEGTLGALAGGGSRTAGGVHYGVSGGYVMGEARYKF